MKQNIIAVDFDGTLCTNLYPAIGEPNEKLIKYLLNRQKARMEVSNGSKQIYPVHEKRHRIVR